MTMKSFFPALAWHAWTLLSFKHSGEGLPKNQNSGVYFMMALAFLTTLVRNFAVLPEEQQGSFFGLLLVFTFTVALFSFFGGPKLLSSYLIINTSMNLISIPYFLVLGLPGLFLMAWELGALITVAMKLAHEQQKNKGPGGPNDPGPD